MKIERIRRIAESESKKIQMPKPIVTLIERKQIDGSFDTQVEIRSELNYDEAYIMCERISRIEDGYICEAQGGCVYIVYNCNK